MSASSTDELRQHERFRLEPMYTSITVQHGQDLKLASIEGHAYDISQSGARIELDEPLSIGQHVAMCLRLPGETAGVFVSGRVVWVRDAEDDPAARRMAVQFTRFLNDENRARLARHLATSARRLAA